MDMFTRNMYKLLALQRVPNKVKTALKISNTLKLVEFSEESSLDEEAEGHDITIEEAQSVAQIVTEIDTNEGRGVEALHIILSVVQQGGSINDGLTEVANHIKPKKKRGRK